MKCQITGKNIVVTDSIRNAIETKLRRMDKYFVINEDVEAKFLLEHIRTLKKLKLQFLQK